MEARRSIAARRVLGRVEWRDLALDAHEVEPSVDDRAEHLGDERHEIDANLPLRDDDVRQLIQLVAQEEHRPLVSDLDRPEQEVVSPRATRRTS